MSEPIVYADTWRPVMEAAAYRCQCAGQCGTAHTKGEGRCPREHDQYAAKGRGPVRLVAAPADPTLPTTAAAGLPVNALRAWCPVCLISARRTKQGTAVCDSAQGQLFALD